MGGRDAASGHSPRNVRRGRYLCQAHRPDPICHTMESHSYLLNAMLSAVQHEALTLVIDGGACVKGVDLLTIASDY